MYRRGIDARAVCRDSDGRVLLVTDGDGRAVLPGGPVGHGEHPADAVARWTAVQTDAPLTVRRPLRVVTDLHRYRRGRFGSGWQHRDVIVFAGELGGPAPDNGQWVAEAHLDLHAVAAITAAALGFPVDPVEAPRPVSWAAMPARDG
ncbi:MAG TPA: NUDIX domain-containing protein, partial [Micromonosporaceae bacterium]|nr:NUDIX domain-containing protein [Micromonosporaceae bacterium]